FADLSGKLTAPLEYEEINGDGRLLIVIKGGLRGLLTVEGEEVLPPIYDAVGAVAEGRAAIVYRDNGQGLYDIRARRFAIALDLGYSSIDRFGETERFVAKSQARSGLYDLSGREIISGAHRIYNFWPDKIAVQMEKDGVFRFHGPDGELLSDAEYASVWLETHMGWIYVKDMQGASAYLDQNLDRVTPEGSTTVFAPTEGGYVILAEVAGDARRGMMGPDGAMILPFAFQQVFSMREGLVTAQTVEGGWGVWDKTGAEVLAPDWEAMTQSYDGRFLARKDGVWRQIDKTGAPVDARRWSRIVFRARDPLATEPYLIAKREENTANGAAARWEVLDFRAQPLVEGDFGEIRQENGRFILTDGDRVVKHPPR
ncbi:MAG: WG repeat-containing protein, partial [Pikeienuella sp.]